MLFGFNLPTYGNNTSAESIVKTAVKAEELGYSDIWTIDHTIMAREYAYPYGRIFESLTVLSHVAAKTSRVRIGTSILSIPLRNPILVAKQVVTLDHLSGGRFIFGVGLGKGEDDIPEFNYLGADYRRRGEYATEAIKIMKTLWTEENPEHSGKYYKFKDCVFEPKPLQKPHPPIWWAGSSDKALSRVATSGDGWQPITYNDRPITPEDYAMLRKRLEGMLNGRKITYSLRIHLDLHVVSRYRFTTTVEELGPRLAAFKRSGAEHVVLDFGDLPAEESLKLMKFFIEDIAPTI
ncbi:Pyrimidine monooxygenase RutA [archaeon HR01]|nr:Pyrimidine monooxygenase RutA [archaeon HR01]